MQIKMLCIHLIPLFKSEVFGEIFINPLDCNLNDTVTTRGYATSYKVTQFSPPKPPSFPPLEIVTQLLGMQLGAHKAQEPVLNETVSLLLCRIYFL